MNCIRFTFNQNNQFLQNLTFVKVIFLLIKFYLLILNNQLIIILKYKMTKINNYSFSLYFKNLMFNYLKLHLFKKLCIFLFWNNLFYCRLILLILIINNLFFSQLKIKRFHLKKMKLRNLCFFWNKLL